MSERPAVLIDVDGPLNPYNAKPTRRPEGYQTHRMTPTGWTDRPLRVWLNPAHGPMLLALADRAELMWCTTWGHDANEWIGPHIGLPKLPVIEVGRLDPFQRSDRIWKATAVQQAMGDRPFAWFDDDFMPADFRWAAGREKDTPTLLLQIDPAVGILQSDIDEASVWLDTASKEEEGDA